SHQSEVVAYDVASGRRILARQLGAKVCPRNGLDFSPDGRFLAVANEQPSVTLFRCDDGEPVWKIPTERPALKVHFADSSALLVHSNVFPVLVLDPTSGVIRRQINLENAELIGSTVTMDGRLLL